MGQSERPGLEWDPARYLLVCGIQGLRIGGTGGTGGVPWSCSSRADPLVPLLDDEVRSPVEEDSLSGASWWEPTSKEEGVWSDDKRSGEGSECMNAETVVAQKHRAGLSA